MNKEKIIRNLENLKKMCEQGKTILVNSSDLSIIDIVLNRFDEIEFAQEAGTEVYKAGLYEDEFYFDLQFSEDGSIIGFPSPESTQRDFVRTKVKV